MQRKAKNQKYLHLPIAFFLRFCYNNQVPAIWGISTVGRTSLQLFSPVGGSRRKAVSVRSAQNSTRKFGALAQLVEQAFRCLSPVPILHRKAVNVKSAQNLAGIFGAIAQLVARYIRIVEVRGSNPLSSTKIDREHSFRTIILYHLSKHQSCKRNESRNMQDIRS